MYYLKKTIAQQPKYKFEYKSFCLINLEKYTSTLKLFISFKSYDFHSVESDCYSSTSLRKAGVLICLDDLSNSHTYKHNRQFAYRQNIS